MEEDLYNNIEENNPVRKVLRQMPELNAPDNFEYNLMVKIQNKQFEPNISESRTHWFSFAAIPASVVAITAVIAFFVTTGVQQDEDMLILDPMEAHVIADNNSTDAERQVYENETVHYRTFDFNKNEVVTDSVEVTNSYKLVINDNDVISKVKIQTPFDDRQSVSVDSYLSGDKAAKGTIPARLVRGGQPAGFNFDGFFFRQNDNRLKELKARMDSIFRYGKERPVN